MPANQVFVSIGGSPPKFQPARLSDLDLVPTGFFWTQRRQPEKPTTKKIYMSSSFILYQLLKFHVGAECGVEL
jgi:hypothetical protein